MATLPSHLATHMLFDGCVVCILHTTLRCVWKHVYLWEQEGEERDLSAHYTVKAVSEYSVLSMCYVINTDRKKLFFAQRKTFKCASAAVEVKLFIPLYNRIFYCYFTFHVLVVYILSYKTHLCGYFCRCDLRDNSETLIISFSKIH